MKSKLILLFIIVLGLLLRILFINNSPPSLYGDELTIALDANSLLKTGHDQLGNILPITFPMGAGRPAMYVYGTIPFIALFGPTALGVRALSILSGLGIIILLYLLVKKLFSQKVGILAALLAAISPWDISLSRGGFEAHLALFLALLATYLFMKAKEQPIFYLLSAISFGLTLHTYPTYKVSLLLFLPLLVWFDGGIKKIISENKKYCLMGIIALSLLGILSLSQTFFSGSETRFANINVFSSNTLKASIEQKINLERQMSQLPSVLVKYFHNKPVEYTKVLINNYFKNFSLDFLILNGDRNPRHNMATMGQIYVVELVLIIIAALTFWQKEKRIILFLILWIIISPIATAIIDLPHALRSSFMLPPLIILAALGLTVITRLRSKLLLFLVIVFFAVQFIFFFQKLYFLSPKEYSNFWSYPSKMASEMAIQNKDKYNFIILSSKVESIEYAYPVYANVEPKIVIDRNKEKTKLSGYPMKQFDNVFIGNILDSDLLKVINNLPGPVLYIGSRHETNVLDDYEIIDGLDGETALIVKKKQ